MSSWSLHDHEAQFAKYELFDPQNLKLISCHCSSMPPNAPLIFFKKTEKIKYHIVNSSNQRVHKKEKQN